MAAALILLPTAALAQAQPPDAAPLRGGFTAGLSLGGGLIVPGCTDCDSLGGPAFELHAGWIFGERLAVLYDASGVAAVVKGGFADTVVSMCLGAAVQYWFLPRLWARVGVGAAMLEITPGVFDQVFGAEGEEKTGAGLTGAVGYELARVRSWAFDVRARVMRGFLPGPDSFHASLSVGAGWY